MSLRGLILPRSVIRVAVWVLALASLMVLPACWVYSVHPLYDENLSPDPDLIADPSLLGAWLRMDEGCHWTLRIAANGPRYELKMAPGEGCKSDEEASDYEAHLLKLGNHRFLDVSSQQEVCAGVCPPLHSFFLVSQTSTNLALTPIDHDWMVQSINSKKVTLEHLPNSSRPSEPLKTSDAITLTAPSSELKKFVRQYADDKSAFNADSAAVIKFKKK